MKSKKALFKYLDAYYSHSEPEYARDGLDHKSISNETYGRRSCIYIRVGEEMCGNLKKSLIDGGFDVNKDYTCKEVIEVHVSYFKGHKWNE